MFSTIITNLIIVNHMAAIMAYSAIVGFNTTFAHDRRCFENYPFFLLFLCLWRVRPFILRTIEPLLEMTLRKSKALEENRLVHAHIELNI